MATTILSVGGIELPAPISVTIDGEVIWSEDTGRALTGLMVGDVIAEKKKLTVKWGPLIESDVDTIKKCLPAGFFSITFRDLGGYHTMTAYRGALNMEPIGEIGGGYFYKNVSVDIIQR